jgi:hypothetical protein
LSHAYNPFALVIFEIGYCFLPGQVWTMILLFMLPTVGGMTGVCNHAQLFFC